MMDTLKMDIDALLGERWFPKETSFEEDITEYWCWHFGLALLQGTQSQPSQSKGLFSFSPAKTYRTIAVLPMRRGIPVFGCEGFSLSVLAGRGRAVQRTRGDQRGYRDGQNHCDAAGKAAEHFHHQKIQIDERDVRQRIHIVNQQDVQTAAGKSQNEGIGHGAHNVLAYVHSRTPQLLLGQSDILLFKQQKKHRACHQRKGQKGQ